jgi:hypothetical protein
VPDNWYGIFLVRSQNGNRIKWRNESKLNLLL